MKEGLGFGFLASYEKGVLKMSGPNKRFAAVISDNFYLYLLENTVVYD